MSSVGRLVVMEVVVDDGGMAGGMMGELVPSHCDDHCFRKGNAVTTAFFGRANPAVWGSRGSLEDGSRPIKSGLNGQTMSSRVASVRGQTNRDRSTAKNPSTAKCPRTGTVTEFPLK